MAYAFKSLNTRSVSAGNTPSAYAIQPFSPVDQNDLVLWLEQGARILHEVSPDVPATNGEPVRRWVNLANPGTSDANQATEAQQPLFNAASGGNSFDGINDNMASVIPATDRDFCLVLRFTLNAIGTNTGLCTLYSGAGGDFNNVANTTINAALTTGNLVIEQNGVRVNRAMGLGTHTVIVNSSTTQLVTYVNGASAVGTTFVNGLNAIEALFAARRPFGGISNYSNMRLFRAVLYSSPRTTDQIAQLQAWAVT